MKEHCSFWQLPGVQEGWSRINEGEHKNKALILSIDLESVLGPGRIAQW